MFKKTPNLRRLILKDKKLEENMKHIVRFKQVFYQIFMYFCMFNLTYFVSCSVIFMKFGTKSDPISIVILSLKSIIFVYMVIKFTFYPYNFKYFFNSFQPNSFMTKHYLLYIIVIITSVGLLAAAPFSWASAIPYVLLLVYILVKKPYKDRR